MAPHKFSSVYPYTKTDPNAPTAASCPGQLNLGWTKENIWYLSWGHPSDSSVPVPQIYNELGHQALQWAAIKRWGEINHLPTPPLFAAGAMSQLRACAYLNHPAICHGTENTPLAAWAQLYDTANQFEPLMQYATDVTWDPSINVDLQGRKVQVWDNDENWP